MEETFIASTGCSRPRAEVDVPESTPRKTIPFVGLFVAPQPAELVSLPAVSASAPVSVSPSEILLLALTDALKRTRVAVSARLDARASFRRAINAVVRGRVSLHDTMTLALDHSVTDHIDELTIIVRRTVRVDFEPVCLVSQLISSFLGATFFPDGSDEWCTTYYIAQRTGEYEPPFGPPVDWSFSDAYFDEFAFAYHTGQPLARVHDHPIHALRVAAIDSAPSSVIARVNWWLQGLEVEGDAYALRHREAVTYSTMRTYAWAEWVVHRRGQGFWRVPVLLDVEEQSPVGPYALFADTPHCSWARPNADTFEHGCSHENAVDRLRSAQRIMDRHNFSRVRHAVRSFHTNDDAWWEAWYTSQFDHSSWSDESPPPLTRKQETWCNAHIAAALVAALLLMAGIHPHPGPIDITFVRLVVLNVAMRDAFLAAFQRHGERATADDLNACHEVMYVLPAIAAEYTGRIPTLDEVRLRLLQQGVHPNPGPAARPPATYVLTGPDPPIGAPVFGAMARPRVDEYAWARGIIDEYVAPASLDRVDPTTPGLARRAHAGDLNASARALASHIMRCALVDDLGRARVDELALLRRICHAISKLEGRTITWCDVFVDVRQWVHARDLHRAAWATWCAATPGQAHEEKRQCYRAQAANVQRQLRSRDPDGRSRQHDTANLLVVDEALKSAPLSGFFQRRVCHDQPRVVRLTSKMRSTRRSTLARDELPVISRQEQHHYRKRGRCPTIDPREPAFDPYIALRGLHGFGRTAERVMRDVNLAVRLRPTNLLHVPGRPAANVKIVTRPARHEERAVYGVLRFRGNIVRIGEEQLDGTHDLITVLNMVMMHGYDIYASVFNAPRAMPNPVLRLLSTPDAVHGLCFYEALTDDAAALRRDFVAALDPQIMYTVFNLPVSAMYRALDGEESHVTVRMHTLRDVADHDEDPFESLTLMRHRVDNNGLISDFEIAIFCFLAHIQLYTCVAAEARDEYNLAARLIGVGAQFCVGFTHADGHDGGHYQRVAPPVQHRGFSANHGWDWRPIRVAPASAPAVPEPLPAAQAIVRPAVDPTANGVTPIAALARVDVDMPAAPAPRETLPVFGPVHPFAGIDLFTGLNPPHLAPVHVHAAIATRDAVRRAHADARPVIMGACAATLASFVVTACAPRAVAPCAITAAAAAAIAACAPRVIAPCAITAVVAAAIAAIVRAAVVRDHIARVLPIAAPPLGADMHWWEFDEAPGGVSCLAVARDAVYRIARATGRIPLEHRPRRDGIGFARETSNASFSRALHDNIPFEVRGVLYATDEQRDYTCFYRLTGAHVSVVWLCNDWHAAELTAATHPLLPSPLRRRWTNGPTGHTRRVCIRAPMPTFGRVPPPRLFMPVMHTRACATALSARPLGGIMAHWRRYRTKLPYNTVANDAPDVAPCACGASHDLIPLGDAPDAVVRYMVGHAQTGSTALLTGADATVAFGRQLRLLITDATLRRAAIATGVVTDADLTETSALTSEIGVGARLLGGMCSRFQRHAVLRSETPHQVAQVGGSAGSTVLVTELALPEVYGCPTCGVTAARRCRCAVFGKMHSCGRPVLRDRSGHYCGFCDNTPAAQFYQLHHADGNTHMLTYDVRRSMGMRSFVVPALTATKFGTIGADARLDMRAFDHGEHHSPELVGIGFACSIPFASERNHAAVMSSMQARALAAMPAHPDWHEVDAMCTRVLADWLPHAVPPVPFDLFVSRFPREKQDRLRRARDELRADRLRPKDCFRSLFLKDEKLTKDLSTGRYAARVISSTSDRAQVALGPTTLAASKFLMKEWDGSVDSGPDGWSILYAGGRTSAEIGAIVHDRYIDGFTHFLDGDYSSFDASVHRDALATEHRLYRHLTPVSGNANVALDAQLDPRGVFTVKRELVARFSCSGRRQSGDANTSVGNSFLNALVIMAVFKKLGLAPGFLSICGDDVLIMLAYQLSEAQRQAIVDQIALYGMKLELQLRESYEKVHYLGSRLLKMYNLATGDTMLLVPEMGRALAKFGWSLRVEADPDAWMHQVALGFRHLIHVPVLGALVRRTLQLTDAPAKVRQLNADMPYLVRLGGPTLVTHADTISDFAKSYDITPEHVFKLEALIDAVPALPHVIDGPDFEPVLSLL